MIREVIKIERIDPLFVNEDIVNWWQSLIEKTFIGQGRSSHAYIVVTPTNAKYIVRVTPIHNPMQRIIVQHELDIYNRVMKNPKYDNFVSDLLYADCPTKYYFNEDDANNAYFVFSYLQGLPLNTFVKSFYRNNMRITSKTAHHWHSQLKNAVAFLKQVKIVHRDIKPANIFVDTEHDRLLLFDFETACIIGHDCKSYDFKGTREYARPEAVALLYAKDFPAPYEYSHVDDLYSISVLMLRDIQPIVAT